MGWVCGNKKDVVTGSRERDGEGARGGGFADATLTTNEDPFELVRLDEIVE